MTCFHQFGSLRECVADNLGSLKAGCEVAKKPPQFTWAGFALVLLGILTFLSIGTRVSAQCQGTFSNPGGYIPFDGGIAYIAGPNTAGDYVAVGYMSTTAFNGLGSVPVPNAANNEFCDTVPLSSSARYFAYVPTASERGGDFSAFNGIIYDPTVGPSSPYSGGVISNPPGHCSSGCPQVPGGPTGVFAWRIPAGETVFVTTGVGGQVLAVDGNTGAFRFVYSCPNCEFNPTGLAVGPDSKLYFTDSVASDIFRINQDGTQLEQIYSSVDCSFAFPCGAEAPTFNGADLYFTSFDNSDGVAVIRGVGKIPYHGTFSSPVNVEPGTQGGSCVSSDCPTSNAGLAFDSNGNLLAGDISGHDILSLKPPYDVAKVPPTIVATLNTTRINVGEPGGITLNQATGGVFFANPNGFDSQLQHSTYSVDQLVPGSPYTTSPYYTFGTSCSGAPDQPEYLQFDAGQHLFVTSSTSSLSQFGPQGTGCGRVWRIDPTNPPSATLLLDLNTAYGNGIPGVCQAPCGLAAPQAIGLALAQAQSPAQTQQGQTIQPGSSTNLVQDFVFNGAPGQFLDFHFDFTTAFSNNTLNVISNTNPFVTNQGIPQATYQAMVSGTSLATTSCFIAPGEGTDSNGNPLCAAMTLQCTNDDNSTPLGDNCPSSTERNLYWGQILDTLPDTFAVPSGNAPTLAMGSDTWTPPPVGSTGCTLVGPETGELCPHSILTQVESVMDPAAKMGGSGTTSNSTFIAGCCEPEWNTVATVPVWSNTTSVPASFTTTPPSAPVPNPNNWVAAPNMSITYGWENLGQTPDTTYPVSGDVTLPNPIACPTDGIWPPVGTIPPSFTPPTQMLSGIPGEGAYEVHYFSTDCTFFEELLFPSTIGATSTQNENLASFKTVPFNVDMTSPNITGLALSPAGGYYAQNSMLTASFTCTDPTSGGVASGIQSCGPQTEPGPTGPASVTVSNAPVNTNLAPGTYEFTANAKDYANNAASAQISYQVVGPAGVGIAMIGNLTVSTGKNMTYLIGIANKGPNTAEEVMVSDALPTGTSLVSAGFAIDSCSFGSGTPSCSIVPPSVPCSVSAGSVICNVGALNAWTSKNPVGALVQITVKVTASAKSTITNTAFVNEANTDTLRNNANWATLVTK